MAEFLVIMPEQAVDQLTWSRPALQRTELGPMLHEFAHKVYQQVESEIIEDQANRQDIRNMEDLSVLCREINGKILDLCVHDKPDYRNLSNHLANRRPDLTTIRGGIAVSEGLTSGVIVPAQLYRMIDLYETRGDIVVANLPPGYQHEVEPHEMAERLVSGSFLNMLHQLSYAHNGLLGPVSTSPDGLKYGNFFDCFNGYELRWGEKDQEIHWQEVFNRNDAGQVDSFSPLFLNKKRHELRNNNLAQDPRTYTGGCPVRHDSFPVITDAARDYLGGERPMNEGISAITRAAQLLGNAVSAGFKPNEELQTSQ